MHPLHQHFDLPQPPAELAAHSQRVKAHICGVIERSGGAIPFSQFMALALYAPNLGYYSAGNHKLGSGGDFTTAPEISALFSRSVAKQLAQILEVSGGDVVEFGAGSGVMAADILQELAQLRQLPEHYYIIEVSADLRQRQRNTIASSAPEWLGRVVWLDELPQSIQGVVVANELLDAMPVARFVIRDGVPQEVMIVWDETSQQFQTIEQPFTDSELQLEIEQLALPEDYCSEINIHSREWLVTIAERLRVGVILLIDYGYSRHDYYHPQRSDGTLQCHYQHRAHPNPLIYPGIQDITAHVDFTAIADTALAAGLRVHGYANQANFLLGCDITGYLKQQLESHGEEMAQQLELTNQLKKLTMPGEMGESFKVIALSRAIEIPLLGFALRDDRHRL